MNAEQTLRKGGDWLISDTQPAEVFTPEQLSDEHRLIFQTADEFAKGEVVPALPELEKKNWALSKKLIARSGELGLLGTDTPEEYGGVGLDKAAAVVVGEAMGQCASFSTSFGAQTGLTIIPILCFGTEAQKQKYLPKILSGEWAGAYCLSESGSGSDALGARAKATKAADGSWILNGEKMWITNGGFADLYIVFAKVDGEHFSAFIVERTFPGVSTGKEEHKMGLHGSSTTPVILQDAKVPAENLLGEVGKGAKIAFNVLNYGRFKLAAMCLGGTRAAIAESVKYASTRRQFGQTLSTFGAIRHKIGEMNARTYALESMLYRTTGVIDRMIEAAGAGSHADKALAALEEFAIEASILKIVGSEVTDFVVDENVQIHGGNGFVSDYAAEGHYRDARVNRIFEGTNEINRLLVPGMLIKRALKGGLPIIAAAQKLQGDLISSTVAGLLGAKKPEIPDAVAGMKKVSIAVLGLAVQTFKAEIDKEQEVLMLAADIITDTFAAESALLRATAQGGTGLHQTVAELIVHDAALRVEANAKTALTAICTGDTLKMMQAALKKLLKTPSINTVAARRALSDASIEKKGYAF
ncbi:MAG: acyl-CoA dehydrogenase family protein [Acidobacteriota bacterium]